MKKFIAAFSVIAILLAAGYSAAWFYTKQRIDAEIDRLYAQASVKGIVFLGDKPKVTGFPMAPTIHYTEGIKVKNWQLSFSDMTLRGFPLPGMPLEASFPTGLIAWVDDTGSSIALEELYATIRIPNPIAQSMYEEDLRAWQQAGGTLEIIDSKARIDDTTMNAQGVITLDSTLQPAAELNTHVRGYAEFIQDMMDDKQIKPFVGLALLAALNNFAQPASGEDANGTPITEKVAALPVRVVNRSVYVGPALVGNLPQILWDKRNPPALRQ